MTECKTKRFEFHALSNREVIAHFDGGDISSDAGGLLLREVEQRTGILKQFAELILPSQPVRHTCPLRNHRFFCKRRRSALLVDRFRIDTRLTPML
jgi:hypothetical protein